MQATPIKQELLRLLSQGPRTAADLATACCKTDRYVRRHLKELQAEGKVERRHDPQDGRNFIYCIITTAAAVPQNPEVAEQVPNFAEQVPMENAQISGVPNFAEQFPVEVAEQNKPTENKQPQNAPPFLKTTPLRHGIPENLPEFHPAHSVESKVAEQVPNFAEQFPVEVAEQRRPGCCTRQDAPEIHACTSCPLQVCDLEHDAVQIGIVDALVAKLLPRMAESKGWARKHIARKGEWWIYPDALHPLTLQVIGDTVIIYSSEPGDTGWIVDWFVSWFGPHYNNPDRLAYKLKHPEIFRDEQTIVISDPALIQQIRSVSAPYADPKSRVEYIPSPNSTTPGFKIYERDGTMRMEFDARDETRARAALIMRQELLQILPDVVLHPGKFLEWRSRYYNPVTQPVIVQLEQDKIVDALDRLTDAVGQLLAEIRKTPALHEDDKLTQLNKKLDSMDSFDLCDLARILGEYTGSETAALAFLGAWDVWDRSHYKHSVIPADVLALLTRAEYDVTNDSLAADLERLEEIRLLLPNPSYIQFSREGISLGKRIIAIRNQDRNI